MKCWWVGIQSVFGKHSFCNNLKNFDFISFITFYSIILPRIFFFVCFVFLIACLSSVLSVLPGLHCHTSGFYCFLFSVPPRFSVCDPEISSVCHVESRHEAWKSPQRRQQQQELYRRGVSIVFTWGYQRDTAHSCNIQTMTSFKLFSMLFQLFNVILLCALHCSMI